MLTLFFFCSLGLFVMRIGPPTLIVLTNDKNTTMVAWTLATKKSCGLSITLQQFKMKVTKLNQITPTF